MANNQIDLESLDTLLAAINDYRDSLETNRTILKNAADVFDQAMGSDPISQRKITKLESALSVLDKATLLVEAGAEEVIRKRLEADDIIEEA